MWKKSIMVSRMAFGSVYCESLRGLFLDILYLYLLYSHATSFSNDYMGGSKLCGLFNTFLYCCHNHCSLCSWIVIKWRPSLL